MEKMIDRTEISHWAVKLADNTYLGGIDPEGRLYVGDERSAFQIFQTYSQAENIAKLVKGSVIPVKIIVNI